MLFRKLSPAATVLGLPVAAGSLILAAYVAFMQAPAPGPNATLTNQGNGAVLIQGSGNSVVTVAPLTPAQSATSLNPSLVGTWRGVTRYRSAPGDLISTGYTRFTDAGEYGFSGEHVAEINDGANAAHVRFQAVAAGTWRSAGTDRFAINVQDVKMSASNLKLGNGPAVALPHEHPLERTLKDLMTPPKGSFQEFRLIEVSAAHLRAEGHDFRGHAVTFEAARQ